jgi:hypothetical protein
MKKTKANILAILLLIVFVFFCVNQSLKYKERYYTGKETVGKITKVGVENLYWDYSVNSLLYSGIISLNSYDFLLEGEKYYVYFDKDDISESSICLTSPYINKSQFDSTYSNQINIDYEKGTEIISFCYYYNKKLYYRSHLFHFKNDTKYIKKRYLVFVNKENPKIAYINLK